MNIISRVFVPGITVFMLSHFSPASSAADDLPKVSVPFEKITLDNGLRVIVHEDRKAPVVTVSIWYHVGSKNEPNGKTGFAHLFEHLMFYGSEHRDKDWFTPLEEMGGTNVNGTTSFDRTNYYQTVPTPALERILWMESDRMGHLLGAITQEKLDAQRSVVKNEKRQRDNQPYGRMFYHQLEGLLPVGHPYRHPPIGSMIDLEAASLDDVHAWFKQYYGAANTVLVLSGDVDVATAKPLVEKHFGDIEAGPPLHAWDMFAPRLTENRYERMYDNVPQSRLSRNWVGPPLTDRDSTLLDLAFNILGSGKTSRLYQELVYKREIATSTSAYLQDAELLSFIEMSVDSKPGTDLEEVKTVADDVLAEFLRKGPTKDELARAKTQFNSGHIRSLETVNGKASSLARGELYGGHPHFYIKDKMEWINTATPKDVLEAARRWLGAGYYELEVMPFPSYMAHSAQVDRTAGMPDVGDAPELSFPDVQEATLSNGVRVVLATRPTIPVVNVTLQLDAGYSSDRTAIGGREKGLLGLSSFTMAMLDEGTKNRSATEIAEELEALGASLGARSRLDTSTVSLSALKMNLRSSLDLMHDVVFNSTFAEDEIEKLRIRWLASLEQEQSSPFTAAIRILPPIIYGDDHAYGVPLTGTGDAASIKIITRQDIVSYRSNWMRPEKATLFVVGDTTLKEMLPLLESAYGGWTSQGTAPEKNIVEIELAKKPRLIVVDRPGAVQSMIVTGHPTASGTQVDEVKLGTMNSILGGESSSRVNVKLREEKGWAYNAFSILPSTRGPQPLIIYAPVQSDKTGPSILEMQKILEGYIASNPATQAELDRAVQNKTRSLPGSFETASAVMSSLLSSKTFDRAFDYPASLTQRYQNLTLEEVQSTARSTLNPESLTWVVVGDWEVIRPQLEALNMGEIEVR